MGALDTTLLQNVISAKSRSRVTALMGDLGGVEFTATATNVLTVTSDTTVGRLYCFGGMVIIEGDAAVELDLPAAEAGMSLSVIRESATGAKMIDPNGTDIINGLGMAAGDRLSLATTAGTGVHLMCVTAGEWLMHAYAPTPHADGN